MTDDMEPEVDVVIPTVRAHLPNRLRMCVAMLTRPLWGVSLCDAYIVALSCASWILLRVGGHDGAAGPFPAQAVGSSGSGAVGHLLL